MREGEERSDGTEHAGGLVAEAELVLVLVLLGLRREVLRHGRVRLVVVLQLLHVLRLQLRLLRGRQQSRCRLSLDRAARPLRRNPRR